MISARPIQIAARGPHVTQNQSLSGRARKAEKNTFCKPSEILSKIPTVVGYRRWMQHSALLSNIQLTTQRVVVEVCQVEPGLHCYLFIMFICSAWHLFIKASLHAVWLLMGSDPLTCTSGQQWSEIILIVCWSRSTFKTYRTVGSQHHKPFIQRLSHRYLILIF